MIKERVAVWSVREREASGKRVLAKSKGGHEESWEGLGTGVEEQFLPLTLYSTTCDVYYHSLLFGGYLGMSFP